MKTMRMGMGINSVLKNSLFNMHLLLGILVGCFALSLQGAEWYVAQVGNASADGTSIENRAAASQLGLIIAGAAAADTVYVQGGEYALSAQVSVPSGAAVVGGYDDVTYTTRTKLTGRTENWLFQNPTVLKCTGSNSRVAELSAGTVAQPTMINGVTFSEGNLTTENTFGGGVLMGVNSQLWNCIIRDNRGVRGGGVGVTGADVLVQNCYIFNNRASAEGAAVFVDNVAGLQVVNSVIANNTLSEGGHSGGMAIRGSVSSFLTNTLFVNNQGGNSTESALVLLDASNKATDNTLVNVTNCIFWSNKRANGRYLSFSNTATVNNTAFQGKLVGNNSFQLQGANDADTPVPVNTDVLGPNFVNPTSIIGYSIADSETIALANWGVTSSSYLINRGINTLAGVTFPSGDCCGQPRIQRGVMDMGAYESADKGTPIFSAFTVTTPQETATVFVPPTITVNPEPLDSSVTFAYTAVGATAPTLPPLSRGVYQVSAILSGGNDWNDLSDTSATLLTMSNARIYFVTPEGTAGGDGNSWATAMDLRSAVAAALDLDTIYLSSGIYNTGSTEILISKQIAVVGSCDSTILVPTQNPRLPGGMSWDFTSPTILSGVVSTRVFNNTASIFVDGITFRDGGGVYVDGANTVYQYCRFLNNSTGGSGAGIHLNKAATVRYCQVAGNTVTNASHGGGIWIGVSNISMQNCDVRNNKTGGLGGGIAAAGVTASIENCILANNSSTNYGGGYGGTSSVNANVTLKNCTVVNNTTANAPNFSGISFPSGVGSADNCIVYGNTGGVGQWNGTIRTSALTGGTPAPGNFVLNTMVTPSFASPIAFAGSSTDAAQVLAIMTADWSLADSSICINRAAPSTATTTGINGLTRPQFGYPDLGAYEMPLPGVVAVQDISFPDLHVPYDGLPHDAMLALNTGYPAQGYPGNIDYSRNGGVYAPNSPVAVGAYTAKAANTIDWVSSMISDTMYIEGKAVTVNPNPQTTPYGSVIVNPLSYTVNGFQGADTFITLPVFGTDATSSSPVADSYLISIQTQGSVSPDYDLDYGTAAYTITRALMEPDSMILTPPVNAIYNGTNQYPVLTLKDWAGPQPVLGMDYRFIGNALTADTHTVILEIPAASNFIYTGPDTGVTYVIGKAPLYIIPTLDTLRYGDNQQVLPYTAQGLFGSDIVSGILNRAPGLNVGTYAYSLSGLTVMGSGASSYEMQFGPSAPQSLEILPAPLTLQSLDTSVVYGDPRAPFAYVTIPATLYYNDQVEGALGVVVDTKITTFDNPPYPIPQGDLGSNLSANYDIAYLAGVLTITKRSISLKADNLTKVAGTLDPPFTASVASGSLAYSDVVGGTMTRQPGEVYGNYTIYANALTILPAADASNYDIQRVDGVLSITRQPVSFILGTDSVVWNGQPQPVAVFTDPSIPTDSYTVFYQPENLQDSLLIPQNAGNYSVLARMNDPQGMYMFAPQYNVPEGSSVPALLGEYAILKADQSDSIIVSDTQVIYNGLPQLPKIAYLPGLDSSLQDSVLIYNSDGYQVSIAQDVGTYSVIVQTEGVNTFAVQADSFIISVLNVPAADIVIGNTFVEYNGQPQPVSVSIQGFDQPISTVDYTVTYNGSPLPPTQVGTYAVKVTLRHNFSGMQTATLIITREKPKPAGSIVQFTLPGTSFLKGSGTDVVQVTLIRSNPGATASVSVRSSGPSGLVDVVVPVRVTFAESDTTVTFPVSIASLIPLPTDLLWQLQIFPVGSGTVEVNPDASLFSLMIQAPTPAPPTVSNVDIIPLVIREFNLSNGGLLSINAGTAGQADVKITVQGVRTEDIWVDLLNGQAAQRLGNTFAIPLRSGITNFAVKLIPSALKSGGSAKVTVKLTAAYRTDASVLTIGHNAESFIFISNAPEANPDYPNVIAGTVIDSFKIIDVLANDVPYGAGSKSVLYVGELIAKTPTGTQRGIKVVTALGATVYIADNQVIYDWSSIQNPELFQKGFSDIFSYRLDQTNNASAFAAVTLTFGAASTVGSEIALSVSGSRKPSVKGNYADPFASPLKAEKSVNYRTQKMDNGEWIAILKNNVRLFSPKSLKFAYKHGLFLWETDASVQVESIGVNLTLGKKGTGTELGSVVLLPPMVFKPAGVSVLLPDSDFVKDAKGNLILIVNGKFFGEKPKAYFEYKQTGKPAVKKKVLPALKKYTSVSGEIVWTQYGEMDAQGNSVIYLKVPKPPAGAAGVFNLVIDSGCGLGSLPDYPIQSIDPAYPKI